MRLICNELVVTVQFLVPLVMFVVVARTHVNTTWHWAESTASFHVGHRKTSIGNNSGWPRLGWSWWPRCEKSPYPFYSFLNSSLFEVYSCIPSVLMSAGICCPRTWSGQRKQDSEWGNSYSVFLFTQTRTAGSLGAFRHAVCAKILLGIGLFVRRS